MQRYLLVALGGALGSMLRYFIGATAAQRFGPRFPVGTLTINISACFLIGLVLWGIKSACTSGAFEALLYDELKAKDREGDYTRIYGRSRAVQAFAVVLAALGAAALARLGYSLELDASVAACVVATAAALSLPPAGASPAWPAAWWRSTPNGTPA